MVLGFLFKPKMSLAYNDTDVSKVLEAVKNEKDQKVLKYLAEHDTRDKVRHEAIHYVSDEAFLIKMFKKNRQKLSIKSFVTNPNLKDNETLYVIARDYPMDIGYDPARTAINKITDEKYLKRIALLPNTDVLKKNRFKSALAAQSPYLKDNDFLINEIIYNRRSAEYARNAILHGKKVNPDILKSYDIDEFVVAAAIKNPNLNMDEKKLISLATHHASHWVREAAVKKISDEEVLRKIAKEDRYKSTEYKYNEELDRMEDVEGESTVRNAAKARLKELGYE